MNNSVVFSYARMNPPTKGHGILVDKVLSLAKEVNADHRIVVSHSHDGIRNPLSQDKKLFYLKQFFPNVNFVKATPERPDIIHNLKDCQSYDNVYVVCGFDRMSTFRHLIEKYNGIEYNFKNIKLVECGNVDTRENYSGTLARNLARSREINYLIETYASLYEEKDMEDILEEILKKKEKKDLNLFMDVCPDHKLKYRLLIDLISAINTFEAQAKKKVNNGKEIVTGNS